MPSARTEVTYLVSYVFLKSVKTTSSLARARESTCRSQYKLEYNVWSHICSLRVDFKARGQSAYHCHGVKQLYTYLYRCTLFGSAKDKPYERHPGKPHSSANGAFAVQVMVAVEAQHKMASSF